MKTVSVGEFYNKSGLADGLAVGEELAVTENGKPKFVVRTVRPRMTRELAEQRAVGNAKGRKFDETAFLASIKK